MQASPAGALPQLQMAQATLSVPPVSNASQAADAEVAVAVQLLGPVSKAVTATLRLLVPSDAAELPLGLVLADGLYAPASNASGAGASLQLTSLRVELASASGAAIDTQRNATTVVLPRGAGGAPGSTAAADAGGPPLFGFLANQVAYPPGNSSTGGGSGGASIPVRLLLGQLSEPATLKCSLRRLPGSSGGGGSGIWQQFLPTKAMHGFLTFEPSAAGKAGAAKQQQQQQLIELPLAWDRIPAEAEIRLGGCWPLVVCG